MEFFEVLQNRYACKKFTDQPVSDEDLKKILEAGRLAPTAKNLQEQKVYVLRSAEALAKADQLTVCRYGAPIVIMVGYDAENVYAYPGGRYDSGAEDATIVAAHMMLAANALGLDTCWLNRFDPDEAKKLFDLPEAVQVTMLLDVGYHDPSFRPLPNHYSRKELDETVTVL